MNGKCQNNMKMIDFAENTRNLLFAKIKVELSLLLSFQSFNIKCGIFLISAKTQLEGKIFIFQLLFLNYLSVLNSPTVNTGGSIIGRGSTPLSSASFSVKYKDYEKYFNRLSSSFDLIEPPPAIPVDNSPLISPVEIPRIFFDDDFNLANPSTFHSIMSSQDLSNTNILQDELSHYIDIAEIQLVQEISKRSPHFFTALANITSLHDRTADCVLDLQRVRSEMSFATIEGIKSALTRIRIKHRIHCLEYICLQLQSIKGIKQCQPFIQILLNQVDHLRLV